ncbi:hypothetical protein ACFSHP_18825 [Novosphingobium panipatense]
MQSYPSSAGWPCRQWRHDGPQLANFERKPDPEPERGRGFVTIWQGDKIAWQGREGEEPAEFRQGELDL